MLNKFLEDHNQERALRSQFPKFDHLPIEDQEDIRRCWTYAKQRWAHDKLVNTYGVACDCDWCGYSFHSREEIAHARENQ